ncbi:MAG: leucyl/phenylalanyl-tRNA--protein transferase [Rubripirellula sp.]|nr:leucyl/phenylalanyl-tRNA--protein transferase [Rubripirellula sp.]
MSTPASLTNLWSTRIRPFLGNAKYRAGGPLRWAQTKSVWPIGKFHGGPTEAIARLHALYPLTPARILAGYAQGIFATGEQDGRIEWHCPNPRAVIRTDEVHVSKRLKGYLRNQRFEIRFNNEFDSVLQSCANRDKTWITDEIIHNFAELHRMQFAHSVEAYRQGQLVGGGYGIALGTVFFLESMFCTENHASKVAFVRLAEKLSADGFTTIDCQFMTEHWRRFGAKPVSPEEFQQTIAFGLGNPAVFSEAKDYSGQIPDAVSPATSAKEPTDFAISPVTNASAQISTPQPVV